MPFIFYWFVGKCGRHVKFTTEKDGYALQGHVIKNLTQELGTRDPCKGQCVVDSRCMSINIGQPINDRVVCELSDSDNTLHPEDLKLRAGFTYTGTEVTNKKLVIRIAVEIKLTKHYENNITIFESIFF